MRNRKAVRMCLTTITHQARHNQDCRALDNGNRRKTQFCNKSNTHHSLTQDHHHHSMLQLSRDSSPRHASQRARTAHSRCFPPPLCFTANQTPRTSPHQFSIIRRSIRLSSIAQSLGLSLAATSSKQAIDHRVQASTFSPHHVSITHFRCR